MEFKRDEVRLVCPYCGGTFTRFKTAQKYCSAGCRIKARNEKAAAELRQTKRYCQVCGNELPGARKRYCSNECAKVSNSRLSYSRYQELKHQKIKKDHLSIAEVNELARAEGLSYGQYFNRHGYNK